MAVDAESNGLIIPNGDEFARAGVAKLVFWMSNVLVKRLAKTREAGILIMM